MKFIKLTQDQIELLKTHNGLKSFAREESLARIGWTTTKIKEVSYELVALKLFRVDKNGRFTKVPDYDETKALIKAQDYDLAKGHMRLQEYLKDLAEYHEQLNKTPHGPWMSPNALARERILNNINYTKSQIKHESKVINFVTGGKV